MSSSQPWYVDLIRKWGFPATFAAAILYFLMAVVSAKLDTSLDLQRKHSDEMTRELSTATELLRQQVNQQWVVIGALQRTCLNTSKTDADRIACATITKPQ